MALSSESSSDVTPSTDGVEIQVGSDITTAGIYALAVDANALTDDERLEIIAKQKVLSGGTERVAWQASVEAADGLDAPVILTPAFVTPQHLAFYLEQTGGTLRTFPCEIIDLGNSNVSVSASGTSAAADRTLGTTHWLSTRSDGKTYVLLVDLGAKGNTERLTIDVEFKVRSTGTRRLLWRETIGERVEEGSPIWISPPIPALQETRVGITEAGSSEASYPWAMVALD